MNMLSNEKINFKSLEENNFKEMMKLRRKIIQEDTDNTISHTAVRNIVLKLGEKIKKIIHDFDVARLFNICML